MVEHTHANSGWSGEQSTGGLNWPCQENSKPSKPTARLMNLRLSNICTVANVSWRMRVPQLLKVGFTKYGLQVWCARPEINICHINFEGQQHPADLTSPE